MESEQVLRPNVTKTLLKGTIGLAVFSVFLEVNASNFVNYLIFLAASYAMLLVYMLYKRSAVYRVGDNGIRVRGPFGKDIEVAYENVQGLSYSQGMLAKRFGCGTVYIELKRGKGTHRTLAGEPVLGLRDVPRPVEVYNAISSMIGPFASAV